MSYQAGLAVQSAIFARLTGDAALSALVDGVHDAPPPGTPQGTRVLLGAEEVIDRSDVTGPGAEHRLVLSVVSDAAGFAPAKVAAVRIGELMTGWAPALPTGRVVAVWFDRADARRLDGGRVRRIDLRFRLRVEGPVSG
jgi:hypothetical protein